MKIRQVTRILALFVVAACVLSVPTVQAADFPTREIKMIVPWSPGGATDIMARQLQPIFQQEFGVNLVIVNKPGGNSAVGLTEVMASRPDGYTVGVASSTILTLMALDQIQWGPERLTNIALLSEDPLLLLVSKDAPWKDLDAFMDHVADHPGQVTVGTSGAKNVNHAMAVLAAQSVGSEIRQVPFDGGSRVTAAIMGGHIDSGVMKPSETFGQIRSGDLVPLGVFREGRLDVLPDVPAFTELGYDIFTQGQVAQISYIVAPANIRPEIREKLTEMFNTAIQSADFQEFAQTNGFLAESVTGAALDEYVNGLYQGLSEMAGSAFAE